MMASIRGNTTLFDGNLANGVASAWAYVGAATDVTLYIDDGGGSANWTIEVATGDGQPGLNAVNYSNPNSPPWGVLGSRIGTARTLATAGVPVAFNLSPFAAQYVRVRPDADITAGSAAINTVAECSRSLRGHQVLWNNVNVSTNDKSAPGYVGSMTNAVIYINTQDAGDTYQIQVAAGTGASGLNGTPEEADWAILYSSDTGDQIYFHAGVGTKVAIDLSPFGGSFIRLKAGQNSTGVIATLAVAD